MTSSSLVMNTITVRTPGVLMEADPRLVAACTTLANAVASFSVVQFNGAQRVLRGGFGFTTVSASALVASSKIKATNDQWVKDELHREKQQNARAQ
jgi:hypothetical protein